MQDAGGALLRQAVIKPQGDDLPLPLRELAQRLTQGGVFDHALFLIVVPKRVLERKAGLPVLLLQGLRRAGGRLGGGDLFGLEPEEIAAAETATGPTESLQKENGETGFTLEHTLGDYDQEERMVEYAALREALRQLPERERQVIALRFYHGLTQQCAAGILHISQVQVSRLERRAVERLREWLAT